MIKEQLILQQNVRSIYIWRVLPNFCCAQVFLVQDWPKSDLLDTSQSLFDVHQHCFDLYQSLV